MTSGKVVLFTITGNIERNHLKTITHSTSLNDKTIASKCNKSVSYEGKGKACIRT